MNALSPCQNIKFPLGETSYFAWRDAPSVDLGFYKQTPMISRPFAGKSLDSAYKTKVK